MLRFNTSNKAITGIDGQTGFIIIYVSIISYSNSVAVVEFTIDYKLINTSRA